MQGYVSLSRKEKYQHFFCLLLLLAAAVMILGLIFFRNYRSPFSNETLYEMQLLEEKNKFAKLQEEIDPFLRKTFDKIDVLQLKSLQPYVETDIENNINDIANVVNNDKISDPRKEAFLQIAHYYKMYFDDKKIAAKKSENILLFEKQFTECSIGFKEREQQLAQKNAAISARNN